MLRELCSVSVNDEIIVVAMSLLQFSAMSFQPPGLFFQVADSGPRESISQGMGEGYGQTEE